MRKNITITFVLLFFVVVGFVVYSRMYSKAPPTVTKPVISLPPVFSNLSTWVPDAMWRSPQKTTRETPYGVLEGVKMEGKIEGENKSIERNYEDEAYMESLGFARDIRFAADGPGASNWGYKKTDNGQMQVVVFSYSTNRILGPEDKTAPFVNLSVFISDEFVEN